MLSATASAPGFFARFLGNKSGGRKELAAWVASVDERAVLLDYALAFAHGEAPLTCYLDKSWEMLDRTLGEFENRGSKAPPYREMLIVGEEILQDPYNVLIKWPSEVADISENVRSIEQSEFVQICETLRDEVYGGQAFDGDDFVDYFWGNFANARDFFRCAAEQGRAVLVVVS
jgi:hypothetical protein